MKAIDNHLKSAGPSASVDAETPRCGLPLLEDVGDQTPSTRFVARVPIGFARRHRVLGLASTDETMLMAVAEPVDWTQIEIVSRWLGCEVAVKVAPPDRLREMINIAYEQRQGQADAFIDRLDRDRVLGDVQQLIEREDLLDQSDRAPVIELVNLCLFEAVKSQASDVHIQPYEHEIVVRLRIDGVLFDAYRLPKSLQDEVISRIKVMARMNIAEKRLPQDGRTTVEVGDRVVDLRVSSIPTSFGERIVIRLLDKGARLYTLEELGMPDGTLESFRSMITLEHGLILVTGPTGSGKSTTLYAALQQINAEEKNVITLEDPIEYQLPGVSQTQISSKKGMTFASGLRSVLRQDPDIIMVGEIRDHETAVMAIQSALTGHLVFSTLHTNDAASAVTRLLDLDIEPYLVASSLIGVLAQRLVRRVCRSCSQPCELLAEDYLSIGVDPCVSNTSLVSHGIGCASCRKTGFSGRIGVFELLEVTDNVRELIQQRSPAGKIKQAAVDLHAAGGAMRTLREAGVEKVLAGLTTADEVVRVTMRASK